MKLASFQFWLASVGVNLWVILHFRIYVPVQSALTFVKVKVEAPASGFVVTFITTFFPTWTEEFGRLSNKVVFWIGFWITHPS